MSDETRSGEESGTDGPWWQLALLIEAVIVVIALAVTFGPSKSKGRRLPEIFLDEPTAFESVVFHLVLTHVVVGVILLVAWISLRRRR